MPQGPPHSSANALQIAFPFVGTSAPTPEGVPQASTLTCPAPMHDLQDKEQKELMHHPCMLKPPHWPATPPIVSPPPPLLWPPPPLWSPAAPPPSALPVPPAAPAIPTTPVPPVTTL
ncbi:hypothetical protein E4T56_gene20042 [Termitomyces sp. T112]|nr:hypothetical protein E4T56_gene20042 [Termitomyces sp. T112]